MEDIEETKEVEEIIDSINDEPWDIIKESVEVAIDLSTVYKEGRELIEEQEIDGHSIKEWFEIYRIDVPSDATPDQLKYISSQVAKNVQELQYRLTRDEAMSMILDSSKESQIQINTKQITEDFKNRKKTLPPSSSMLRALALQTMDSYTKAEIFPKVAVQLWTNLLRANKAVLDTINQINVSNAHEMKLLGRGIV